VCRSKSAANPINPQVNYSSGVSQFVVRDNAGNINNTNMSGVANNTWYLFGGTRSGNNTTTYRDGTASATTSNAIGTTTLGVTSVGAIYPGTGTPNSFVNGDIAEIIVCGLSDREIVEGYAAHKWGLAASLPALHPYKSVAP
jgi:hypothetical protein